MINNSAESTSLINRFQSKIVLRIARVFFLLSAAISLLTVVGGLAVAFYFHTLTVGEPPFQPVPAGSVSVPTSIDFQRVDARMSPPQSLRFVVTRGTIAQPLIAGEIIGYFQATTSNGLARFPDDFDILGGRDADVLRRVPFSATQPRSALAITSTLADKINTARIGLNAPEIMNLELVIVARDVNGALSVPTTIDFNLSYAPQAPPASSGPAPTAAQPDLNMSDLERLAYEIVRQLGLSQVDENKRALQRAMSVPQRCNASDKTPEFVENFRQAFEHAREKLQTTNIEAFYSGVCEAWNELLARQQLLRSQAEGARNAVLVKNAEAKQNFLARAAAGWAGRNLAFAIVGSAFATFLMVALLLAVLAIENHSKALRETVATLTESGKIKPKSISDV